LGGILYDEYLSKHQLRKGKSKKEKAKKIANRNERSKSKINPLGVKKLKSIGLLRCNQ